VFLVPQPNNSYRALNKNIEIESVPILDVHSTFQWFAKAKYFTTLELNPADHQIPLAAASSPDTIAGHDFP
jgi:hypothetical protein